MKRSVKELLGYTLQAIDGPKGKVNDFLFDDETWIIRYVEADLGSFFSEKRVLIPQNRLNEPHWDNKHFTVKLTVKKIENSPDLDFAMPVSRAYEKKLADHYEIEPYWPANMTVFNVIASPLYPQSTIKIPKSEVSEEELDTHLRSFREIRGYFIKALDDRFGHIHDLIIDDEMWRIVYVVVDTKNFVPWSKRVLLPIETIESKLPKPGSNHQFAKRYNKRSAGI